MNLAELDWLERKVAAAIRGACPSDEACAAAGIRCLDIHPVHSIIKVQGNTTVVEADVAALAKLMVRILREHNYAPCWGCTGRRA